MARSRATKAEPLEGFVPPKVEQVIPRQPTIRKQPERKAPTKLFLREEDVPVEMRLNLPPSLDRRANHGIDVRESGGAIQEMLDKLAEKRAARAIAEAREPVRNRVARETAEAFAALRAKVKVEGNDE
jgi:predicted ArsR family transcriptional regulator